MWVCFWWLQRIPQKAGHPGIQLWACVWGPGLRESWFIIVVKQLPSLRIWDSTSLVNFKRRVSWCFGVFCGLLNWQSEYWAWLSPGGIDAHSVHSTLCWWSAWVQELIWTLEYLLSIWLRFWSSLPSFHCCKARHVTHSQQTFRHHFWENLEDGRNKRGWNYSHRLCITQREADTLKKMGTFTLMKWGFHLQDVMVWIWLVPPNSCVRKLVMGTPPSWGD